MGKPDALAVDFFSGKCYDFISENPKEKEGIPMAQNKTICLLNDSFPPLIDGVANAVMNYARYLPQQGLEPVVLTPQHPEAEDSAFPYSVIRYPSIDLREKTGYLAGVPFSPEIANRLEGKNVAVLHSHCPIVSTLLGRKLRQIVDAPLVLTYHTKFDIDIANVLHSHALQEGSKRVLLENINACDEIWTVSQGAGENLRSLGYTGEYLVMPNGVDFPQGRVSDEAIAAATAGYDLPANVPIYLSVGRIMWYKGLKIILDALARRKAEGGDFRMVFIGQGGDFEEVTQYAKALGLMDKCFFLGAIQDRDILRAWYCKADLFLFPSTFDTNGLVVREAAACGLASVLIRGSCAAEGVTQGQNGFLIEENAESLCACLKALDKTPGLPKTVGETAQRELYISWEDSVKTAAQRYEVVAQRYRQGDYPKHRKPMEYFLKANGELMEDLGHLIHLREEIRRHRKER